MKIFGMFHDDGRTDRYIYIYIYIYIKREREREIEIEREKGWGKHDEAYACFSQFCERA